MNFTTSMKESGKRLGSPGGVISWHAQYSVLAHALETFYSNIGEREGGGPSSGFNQYSQLGLGE